MNKMDEDYLKQEQERIKDGALHKLFDNEQKPTDQYGDYLKEVAKIGEYNSKPNIEDDANKPDTWEETQDMIGYRKLTKYDKEIFGKGPIEKAIFDTAYGHNAATPSYEQIIKNINIVINKRLLNSIAEKLNEYIKLDHDCIARLFTYKSWCSNSNLENHPTVVVSGMPAGNNEDPTIGCGSLRVIGLLNGLFTIPESTYRLAATYSDDPVEFDIVGFTVVNIAPEVVIPQDNQNSDH